MDGAFLASRRKARHSHARVHRMQAACCMPSRPSTVTNRSKRDASARAIRRRASALTWPPHEPEKSMVQCAPLRRTEPSTFHALTRRHAQLMLNAVSNNVDCAGARVGADHSQPTKGPLDARACSRPARHSYRACLARLPRAWQARAPARLFSSPFTVSSRCLTEVCRHRVLLSG